MGNKLEIYTDGSCLGNPGQGGLGIVFKFGDKHKEHSEGFRMSTNNRMELLAVIVALEKITNYSDPITIYSDSKYVVDSVEKGWLFNWVKKDFKKKKNKDLWLRFLKIYEQYTVNFVWVKGHSSNKLNNICDKIAVAAARSNNLKIDDGYEIS